jgi:DNA polymerase III epsilon subunit family exonuclease
MRRYSNLISDSVLISETIELIRHGGGSLEAVEIAVRVLQMPSVDADLAALLVGDLVAADPRLRMGDDARIRLAKPNSDRRDLTETDFVVFDTETTGAKPPYSRMTEIGAYRVRNGEIVGEFETLINPESPVPSFITGLTGITNEMVRRAPLFSEIMPDLLDFIGDAILVAHNAAFDMKFLNAEIARVFEGYEIANTNLCTVKLARKLLPNLENHRLHTVAEHFSIPIYNRHRAAGDALATAKIFIRLLEYMQKHGVYDIATVRKFKF